MILRCVTNISDPQEVEREYKSGNGISQDEARMRFLGVAVTWPTYGSVFFEVKVSFLGMLSQKSGVFLRVLHFFVVLVMIVEVLSMFK